MMRVATVLVLLAAACGPIEYASDVARHANDAVDAAREANAERYAPYWYTRAVEYLHEARELAGHADFQAANRFGRLARESAQHAITDAMAAEKDPALRPRDVSKDVAPAKPDAKTDAKTGAPALAPAKDDAP
jgi:hypothetical protein